MTPLSTENFPYTVGYVMELLSLDERELTSLVRTLEISPRRDDETGRTIFTHKDIEQLKKAVDMQKHGDSLETIARHFNPKAPSAQMARESGELNASESEEQSDASRPSSPKPRSAGSPSLTTPPPQASPANAPEISPTLTNQPEPVRKPRNADRVDLPPLQVSNTSSTSSQNRGQSGQKPQSATPARPVLSVAHSSTSTPSASHDSITVMIEAVSQVKEGILKDLSRLLDDKLAGLDEVVVELIRCKSENDSLKKKLNEAIENREVLQEELSRFKPVQFGFYKKT